MDVPAHMVEVTAPATLGINVGAAGGLGVIVGYAAKKVMKLMAILVGAQLAFLAYLERTNIIAVDWAALTGRVNTAAQTGQSVGMNLFDTLAGISVLGGSFAAGAALGFKRA